MSTVMHVPADVLCWGRGLGNRCFIVLDLAWLASSSDAGSVGLELCAGLQQLLTALLQFPGQPLLCRVLLRELALHLLNLSTLCWSTVNNGHDVWDHCFILGGGRCNHYGSVPPRC